LVGAQVLHRHLYFPNSEIVKTFYSMQLSRSDYLSGVYRVKVNFTDSLKRFQTVIKKGNRRFKLAASFSKLGWKIKLSIFI